MTNIDTDSEFQANHQRLQRNAGLLGIFGLLLIAVSVWFYSTSLPNSASGFVFLLAAVCGVVVLFLAFQSSRYAHLAKRSWDEAHRTERDRAG